MQVLKKRILFVLLLFCLLLMNINLVHAQDEEYDSANSWRYKDGEQYYFDNSVAMLKNTTTPDGYILDYDGRIKRN